MGMIRRIVRIPVFIEIVKAASNVCLAAMFVVVMIGVVSRYVMASPIRWSDELARYLMIYMVFLGSAVSFRAEKHPSLTFLIDKLPKNARLIWDSVIDLLVLVVLVMVIHGGLEMLDGPSGRTPALRMRYSWIYVAIPIGGAAMVIEVCLRILSRVLRVVGVRNQ